MVAGTTLPRKGGEVAEEGVTLGDEVLLIEVCPMLFSTGLM